MKSQLDCDSVLEKLSEFIDAEAREELCKEIAEHLRHCKDCTWNVDTVRQVITLYNGAGRASEIEVPMRATAKLTAAMSREYKKGTKRSV